VQGLKLSILRRSGEREMFGADVRFGSKADILLSDVRFTPESGHSPLRLACLVWAKNRQEVEFTLLAKKPARLRRAKRDHKADV
jgi:hypothetical protein